MAPAPADPRGPSKPSRAGDLHSALRFWLALVLFVALVGTTFVIQRLSTQHDRLLAEWSASRGAKARLPQQFIKAQGELRLLTRFAGGLALAEFVLLGLSALHATRYVSRARRDSTALRASEQFARATLDALPAQIAILDDAGVVLAVNRPWRQFNASEQVIERVPEGANFLHVCDAASGRRMHEASAIAAAVRRVQRGLSEHETLETAGHAAGGEAWFLCRIGRFAADAPFGRVVVAFEDITPRVRAEEEVRRAKEAADAANAAKSAFLANMSHEIRTPMSAVLGYAELLQDRAKDVTGEQRDRALTIIRRNGEHLLAIINDILDLSKIEAGKLVLEPSPTDLPQVVADVALLMRQRSEQRGLSFEVVCDGPVPRTITTDGLRLRQILINLVGNAIKFTTRGGVTLRVACEPTLSGSVVQFDVIDSGIGIAPAPLARLFEPFMQADESATRRFGGTGLGLSISRRLANLLGGDIVAQSDPGQGTTFSLWIAGGRVEGAGTVTEMASIEQESPRSHSVANEPPAIEPMILRLSGKVLLVEDGEDNRELLCVILRDAGLEVFCAENGQAGVETVERDQDIGLVLMDMQMPEMDGYTATRLLRARGYRKPIIALTANAMTDDRQRCLDAGCDEYCSKPVNRMKLLGTIARLLNPSAGATTALAAPIQSTRAADGRMSAMLLRFVERLPTRVSEIAALLDQKDLDGLRRAVHQLKGAAGGYGYPQISERAQQAEDCLRASAPIEQIQSHVDELLALVRSVSGYPGADQGGKPPEMRPAQQSGNREAAPVPEEAARTDTITGLPNRSYGRICLAGELSRSRRSQTPLSCVLLTGSGLSEFAQVEQQDRLILAARILQAACNDSLVTRWGEHQFLIALTGCDESAAAAAGTTLIGRLAAAIPGVRWSMTVREVSFHVRSAARLAQELDRAAGETSLPGHIGPCVNRPAPL